MVMIVMKMVITTDGDDIACTKRLHAGPTAFRGSVKGNSSELDRK